MNEFNEGKLVEVYAGNILDAGLVRSLLESEGIQAFLKNEIMGTLNPWWVAPGGAGAVSVIVASADVEKAKSIVANYEQNAQPL